MRLTKDEQDILMKLGATVFLFLEGYSTGSQLTLSDLDAQLSGMVPDQLWDKLLQYAGEKASRGSLVD